MMIDRKKSTQPACLQFEDQKVTPLSKISNKHQKLRYSLNPNSNYLPHPPDENQRKNHHKKRSKVQKQQPNHKKQNVVSDKVAPYRHSVEEGLLKKMKKVDLSILMNKLEYFADSQHFSSPTHSQQIKTKEKKTLDTLKFCAKSKENQRTVESQKSLNFYRGIFEFKYVIGRGGFGKVWKVQLKKSGKIYALKQMSKALIIGKKSIPSVMNEKRLLTTLKHDFLVNMVQSFQDRENLYLVMDYLQGGDLRHLIAKYNSFSEEQAKFIIACLLIGLSYIHQRNIIHRDIKPQNLVLDQNGYIRITDFGVARVFRPNNSSETSGTPGYMAPEVLCRQNHTFSVDHFAIGVIGYELMLKKRPYTGRNRKQIRNQILSRQVQIKKNEIPDNWSLESADFINRLLQRKPTNRLGFVDDQQIRCHPWLRQYAFDKLKRKEYKSPFGEGVKERWGRYQRGIDSESSEAKELIMQNEILLRNMQIQQLFNGYESSPK